MKWRNNVIPAHALSVFTRLTYRPAQIWPPQPVHSHRLVRAIARQIFSTSTSNSPKTFDFCPDGSPDIQRESGKTRMHIIGRTLVKTLREGFWEGNPFPPRTDRRTTPAKYIMEHEKDVPSNTGIYAKDTAKPLHKIIGRSKRWFSFLLAFAHNSISLIK